MRRLILLNVTCVSGLLLVGCGTSGDSPAAKTMPAADRHVNGAKVAEHADVAGGPVNGHRDGASSSRMLHESDGGKAAPSGEESPRESRVARSEKFAEPATSSIPTSDPAPAPDVAASKHFSSDSSSPVKPKRQIQSGTLTAGSFDDNERFDDYQKFLSETLQKDPNETFPRFALGERVEIHVRDEQGKPVGDARVIIRPANNQQDQRGDVSALLDLTTGSDGRTMFLTGIDGGGGARQFNVSVRPADGSTSVSQDFQIDARPWKITLPKVESARPTKLDLALVIDTTGSMSDELEYLKVEIDSIAATVSKMFPNVDQRYSLIVYRDEGDQYVTRTFDFTGKLSDFRSTLSNQLAAGGGDYPEAMHVALEHAGKLSWRDRDAARVLFLVGDAPPHDQYSGRTLDAVKDLRKQGVRIFPVASSGVQLKAEFIMRAGSFLTLGQYLFLTDHSGVGNPHAKPHVPEYQVERLDRMMIRMIASELAGKKLAPTEVIAIEKGTSPDDLPSETVQSEQQAAAEAQAYEMHCCSMPASVTSSIQWKRVAWSGRWVALAMIVVGAFVFDAIVKRRRRTRFEVEFFDDYPHK